MQPYGVLVGSDQAQEWLLDHFVEHFRKYNSDCPIAFADFGMSPKIRTWCEERGPTFQVFSFPPQDFGPSGFLFREERWEEWKLDRTNLTPERMVCFLKPSALALSPFQRTLWLDLDCEVRGDLTPLFSLPLSPSGLGAAPCGSTVSVKNLCRSLFISVDKYNTGAILVDKNSLLLTQWIEILQRKISFQSDEGSLSFASDRMGMPIIEIDHRYNWPVLTWGENKEALIYHWMGKKGKERLREKNCYNR